MQAACPPNNDARLQALYDYEILDTPYEPEFDEITSLAAEICKAPISVINLIDRDRQWFKSKVGLEPRQTELDISICAHALLQPGLFVVEDTLQDERFTDNPLVTGEPHLRFYAGALLETKDGQPLGTLCVLDYQPRSVDESQKKLLKVLARQVMQLLELRLHYRAQRNLNETLQNELSLRQEMTSIVSHDLRTPLSGIRMAANLLLQFSKDNDGDIKECATVIDDCSNQMARIISDLTDYSMIDHGQLSLKLESVSPGEILANAARRYQNVAEQSNISLVSDIPDNLPKFAGDPERIGQALDNLISNALKFTPSEGTIRLSANADTKEVSFSVADTGPGIAEEDLPRIFDRFWQPAKNRAKGRGLGLAIVKGIVESHRGRAEAFSKPGEGAIVRLTFPLRCSVD